MSKAEELRKNIAGSLGLQYERRGVEEFFLVAYRHVDDLIQAVRDECLDESEQIRAKVNHCPGWICNVCPIDGTGYCP